MFPNPGKYPELFRKWILLCKNEDLTTANTEDVYRKERICHLHFSACDISSNMYLKKTAIPSLYLPPEQSELQDKICGPAIDSDISNPAPTTSHQVLPPGVMMQNLVETSKRKRSPILETREQSQEIIIHTPKRKRYSGILSEVEVCYKKDLTPKARKLYQKTRHLTKSMKRLRKKGAALRKQLKSFTTEQCIERVTSKLEPHIADFIKSQIRLQGKPLTGRRYTIDDKLLGLILYKQSSYAYKMLSKLFKIPSRKTIKKLLQNIKLIAGVSEHTFKCLEGSVGK